MQELPLSRFSYILIVENKNENDEGETFGCCPFTLSNIDKLVRTYEEHFAGQGLSYSDDIRSMLTPEFRDNDSLAPVPDSPDRYETDLDWTKI